MSAPVLLRSASFDVFLSPLRGLPILRGFARLDRLAIVATVMLSWRWNGRRVDDLAAHRQISLVLQK